MVTEFLWIPKPKGVDKVGLLGGEGYLGSLVLLDDNNKTLVTVAIYRRGNKRVRLTKNLINTSEDFDYLNGSYWMERYKKDPHIKMGEHLR